MKLITSIKPRRDGSVVVEVKGRREPYVFKADETGDLACDVDDEAVVAQLLNSDNFAPADPADYDRASALVMATGAGADDDEPGDDDPDSEPDDDPVDENAAPIEAGTPPAEAPIDPAKAEAQPEAPAAAPIEAGTPPAAQPKKGGAKKR
jgi:hypothetical protein